MVNGIGNASDLARAAIDAARASHQRIARSLDRKLDPGPGAGAPGAAEAPSGEAFSRSVLERVREVDETVRSVDQLPRDLLVGNVKDFHELAVQLKQSELTFRFSLEVRDKLIDAYREVMRMGV